MFLKAQEGLRYISVPQMEHELSSSFHEKYFQNTQKWPESRIV